MAAAKTVSRDDAARFICDLLQERSSASHDIAKLRDELSARVVAKALGQTTGFLYHHWGSFDGFLFEVSGLGWRRLVDSLVRAYEKTNSARAIMHAYVDFAAEYPVLYWLLAERPLTMSVVRSMLDAGTALPSFQAFVTYVELMTRAQPGMTARRARAMHAAAHGIASQLLSNRLTSTPDTRDKDARAVAREITDAFADAFFGADSSPTEAKKRAKARRSPARDPKAASPARPRTTSRRASSKKKSSRRAKSGT